jgi:hypothetical protein
MHVGAHDVFQAGHDESHIQSTVRELQNRLSLAGCFDAWHNVASGEMRNVGSYHPAI